MSKGIPIKKTPPEPKNHFTGESSLGLEKIHALVDELRRANITDVERRREHVRQVKMKK